MARADQIETHWRIIIEQPVSGVRYSLQSGNDLVLDPKSSKAGEALRFDFPIRISPGPKFFGDQVRREGPVRRFVYIRVGQLAGDAASCWSRRIKIDIHDVGEDLVARALEGGVLETTIIGTAADGTPSCATVRPVSRQIVAR